MAVQKNVADDLDGISNRFEESINKIDEMDRLAIFFKIKELLGYNNISYNSLMTLINEPLLGEFRIEELKWIYINLYEVSNKTIDLYRTLDIKVQSILETNEKKGTEVSHMAI